MSEQQKGQQMADSELAPSYRHAIDLTVCHKPPKRHGSVTVFYTWLRLADSWQACLALVPSTALVSHDRVIPCIVPLSTAHKWAEETGDELDCMITAGRFCANLGWSPFNKRNVIKVMSVIRENLYDLLTIPPRMEDAPKMITAEMEVIDNQTGKVKEFEVSDDHGAV
jgi:hypothetical protein